MEAVENAILAGKTWKQIMRDIPGKLGCSKASVAFDLRFLARNWRRWDAAAGRVRWSVAIRQAEWAVGRAFEKDDYRAVLDGVEKMARLLGVTKEAPTFFFDRSAVQVNVQEADRERVMEEVRQLWKLCPADRAAALLEKYGDALPGAEVARKVIGTNGENA